MTIHSCQFKGCIHEAHETCNRYKGCGAWLCPDHIDHHNCKQVEGWLTASTALNAVGDLLPGDVRDFDPDWREKMR